MVAIQRAVLPGKHTFPCKVRAVIIDVGVDEYDKPRCADIDGDLRAELMVGLEVQLIGKIPVDALESIEQLERYAVIAAPIVTPSDDADRFIHRLISQRSRFSTSYSCTRNGICPSAWVLQERHGS